MFQPEEIADKSNSLIELLTAQCADMEKLLTLAREETLAAEQGDFLGILDIVSDRERIGKRLETFQRQLAELRGSLGESDAVIRRNQMAARVIEIANLTIAQDNKTKLLLQSAQRDAAGELNNLGKFSRGSNAYLRSSTKGLSYERDF